MYLEGRLILDCSSLLPGPFIGKLLAQKGARVIKIENPHYPDGAKSMGEFYDDLNELKEIVSLDLTLPSDIEKFHQWIKQADGLIEGFRPKTKKKLGLDFDTLHSINPRLCIVSLIGYPEHGPLKDRAGHDINFMAVSGIASFYHEMPALPLADYFSAYEGALGLTAAMDSVTRGKQGSRVVVCMYDLLKEAQSGFVREFKRTGVAPSPGNTLFSGKFPCYRIYHSKDHRKISVGAVEHKFWKKICEILEKPHLISQGYTTGEQGEKVIKEIQQAFLSKTWNEWSLLFKSSDCCVEPILDYSEVFSHGV